MSLTEKIPFLDLITPHQELEPELTAVFQKVLQHRWFRGRPDGREFRKRVRRILRCEVLRRRRERHGRRSICVDRRRRASLATSSLRSRIPSSPRPKQSVRRARDLILSISTSRRIQWTLRTLREYLERECYVDRETGKPYHRKFRAPVTAIVPVHIYGQCADMDPILELARRYNLIVVEDACQAHGAEYFSQKENRWRKAGSMGHAAAFSFYPGKNLGACGEAGAVTTNSEEMARKMRMLRDHGQLKKYYHSIEGYNGRLDSLQAGLLSVKLRHLADWNQQAPGSGGPLRPAALVRRSVSSLLTARHGRVRCITCTLSV